MGALVYEKTAEVSPPIEQPDGRYDALGENVPFPTFCSLEAHSGDPVHYIVWISVLERSGVRKPIARSRNVTWNESFYILRTTI